MTRTIEAKFDETALPRWAREYPEVIDLCKRDLAYRTDVFEADKPDYRRLLVNRARGWGGARANAGGSRPRAGRPPRTLYERATVRVEASTQLSPHRDFILADWPEGDEHLRWIISAPIREILDWIEAGKR